MKRTFLLSIFLFLFCFSNASAAIFTIDADLNSVTLNYFESVPMPPPYTIPGPVNTGLYLNSGDLLTISATGLWTNGSPWGSYPVYGPNGNFNENIAPTYPGAGYPVGALLGRIGNNGYFFIGSSYSILVSQSGILYLGFNDTDYGNNLGTVSADVNIIPLHNSVAYIVNIDQDTSVVSGTQWVNENKCNEGAAQEIGATSANDGYNTRGQSYLGFDLSSNNDLWNALLRGDRIEAYTLYAYNVRTFAMGDAVINDVVTSIYYVNNDNWWEGPYVNWTVVDSPNALDGITYENQVNYNEYLASENENNVNNDGEANKWYSWTFQADALASGGINDDPYYLSLAMVPNTLSKTSSWWLVSGFASKENVSNPHPHLVVYTTPILKPISIDIDPWIKLNIIDWKFKWAPIRVAILSKPDFDAPKMIDRSSLTFGPNGYEDSLAYCNPLPMDVNADKSRDLVCLFYTGLAGFQCGDTTGTLRGKTKDGIPIEGSDKVKIIPCR